MIHHEGIAAALRTTLGLLRAEDKASNAPIIAAALVADRKRVARSKGKKGHGSKAAIQARRKLTAAFLDTFDRKTPMKPENARTRGLGTLIRRGYLKKKRGGYVRTAKEFTA